MVHRDASALITERQSGDHAQDEHDEIIGNEQLGVDAPIKYQTAPADVDDGFRFLSEPHKNIVRLRRCPKEMCEGA
jgi:hypothetical protein